MKAVQRRSNRALEEARRQRLDLRRALLEVEKVLSGPAAGRIQQWRTKLAKALERLCLAIDEHVSVTEGPGGLFEDIMAEAPRLERRIEGLRYEHPGMRASAAALQERLASTPVGDAWTLEEARADVQRLLGVIIRHRQRGADLVWEAYSVDIGGLE